MHSFHGVAFFESEDLLLVHPFTSLIELSAENAELVPAAGN
jgi:hypothetical protein